MANVIEDIRLRAPDPAPGPDEDDEEEQDDDGDEEPGDQQDKPDGAEVGAQGCRS